MRSLVSQISCSIRQICALRTGWTAFISTSRSRAGSVGRNCESGLRDRLARRPWSRARSVRAGTGGGRLCFLLRLYLVRLGGSCACEGLTELVTNAIAMTMDFMILLSTFSPAESSPTCHACVKACLTVGAATTQVSLRRVAKAENTGVLAGLLPPPPDHVLSLTLSAGGF